jgi:hypothetical protein
MTDKSNGNEYPRCIVIEGEGKATALSSKSMAIPCNDNSTRAMSKKIRVYVLRDFILRNYPSSLATGSSVLDVAGGKGDLSWILRNFDGVDSIIVDPRTPSHQRLLKSVDFLLHHPEEAVIRSVEGLPTHQPLAKLLLPRILDQEGQSDTEHAVGKTWSNHNGFSCPTFMRIHVNNTLVEILRRILNNPLGSEDVLKSWDEFWETEKCEIESNKVQYGGTVPKPSLAIDGVVLSKQITDARLALDAFHSLHMIVGFHP